MSIQSMMNHRADFYEPDVPNKTTTGGLAVSDPQPVMTGVPGRLSSQSSRQQDQWGAWVMVQSYAWITLEPGIKQNWFLELDGRRFRVLNRLRRYAAGTIPDHYRYELEAPERE